VTTASLDPRPVELALVLKGGGAKGLALVAAYGVLERAGYRFSTFVGTSAGAILASLLAVGYRTEDLQRILSEKDFTDFLDPLHRQPINFLGRAGLHRGLGLLDWLEALLAARLEEVAGLQPPYTLGQVSKYFNTRLVIYATSDSSGLVRYDSAGEGRDAKITDAVRASMAIPLFFTPAGSPDDPQFDGGLLANFPLEEFLERERPRSFVAIYLRSRARSPAERAGEFLLSRVMRILIDRDERETVERYLDRVIQIDPWPVGTTEFDLTTAHKDLLLARGRHAALRYLRRYDPEGARKVAADVDAELAHLDQRAQESIVALQPVVRRRRRNKRIRMGIVATLIMASAALALLGAISLIRLRPDRAALVAGTWVLEKLSPPTSPDTLPTLWQSFVDDSAGLPTDSAWLARHVGQLLLVHADGEVWPGIGGVFATLVDSIGIGGLLLRHENVQDAQSQAGNASGRDRRGKLRRLVDSMQAHAKRAQGIPLLIAVDQEGGETQSLGKISANEPSPVAEVPAALAIGATRNSFLADTAAFLVGRQLKALGINTNFAPVADAVQFSTDRRIRDRSFGSNTGLVAQMVSAWQAGQVRAGILGVVKHFPGHGSTEEGDEESLDLPESFFNCMSFRDALVPFRAVLADHPTGTGVMSSHFAPVNIADGNVTTSTELIAGALRGESPPPVTCPTDPLGFQGLVFTDVLDLEIARSAVTPQQMRRAGVSGSTRRADILAALGIAALEAGHDILVIGDVRSDRTRPERAERGSTTSDLARIRETLVRYFLHDSDAGPGELDRRRARLHKSLERILQAKKYIASQLTRDVLSQDQLEIAVRRDSADLSRFFQRAFGTIVVGAGLPTARNGSAFIAFGSNLGCSALSADTERELLGWAVPLELQRMIEENRPGTTQVRALPRSPGRCGPRAVVQQLVEALGIVRPSLLYFVVYNAGHVGLLRDLLLKLDASSKPVVRLQDIVVVVQQHPAILRELTDDKDGRRVMNRVNYVFGYSGGVARAKELARFLYNPPRDISAPLPPVALPGLVPEHVDTGRGMSRRDARKPGAGFPL